MNEQDVTTSLALLFEGLFRPNTNGCWIWMLQKEPPEGDRGDGRYQGSLCIVPPPVEWMPNGIDDWDWVRVRDNVGIALSPRRYVALVKYGEIPFRHVAETMCGHPRCMHPDHVYIRPYLADMQRAARANIAPVKHGRLSTKLKERRERVEVPAPAFA